MGEGIFLIAILSLLVIGYFRMGGFFKKKDGRFRGGAREGKVSVRFIIRTIVIITIIVVLAYLFSP
jgi:hypothetical protein